MTAPNDLLERIDAEFDAAEAREKEAVAQKVQEYEDRQRRFHLLAHVLEQLPPIWRPRLEALAKKFGDKVNVEPKLEPGRRSATFRFDCELAQINLRFSVAPDPEVRKLVVRYDLDILPILMKYENHSEIEFPLEAIDKAALTKWLDDRIVSFVKTYLALRENQYYLKDHLVEDPLAKVKLPKYAAGATLECDGKTLYFLNETTCREFQKSQSSPARETS